MRNFDEKIEEWRQELMQIQAMEPDDVDELVDHMEQTLFDLSDLGLSKEEAYWVARSRLGDIRTLRVEYTKVNQRFIWLTRLIWLLSGYLIFTSIPVLIRILITPIYAWEIDRLLSPMKWLFGPQYQFPILLFLGFFAVGGVLLGGLFTNNRVTNRFIWQLTSSQKPVISILGLSGVLLIGQPWYGFITTRAIGVTTFGNVAASQALFTAMWQLFLIATLLFSLFYTRRKYRLRLTS